MNESINNIDSFYLKRSEPNKSCFLALRSIILNFDSRLSETVKYGMPCFCIGKKPICYLWKDKKTSEPYILMVDGLRLTHYSLEQGDRAKMKIYRIDPNGDLNLQVIHEILEEATQLIS